MKLLQPTSGNNPKSHSCCHQYNLHVKDFLAQTPHTLNSSSSPLSWVPEQLLVNLGWMKTVGGVCERLTVANFGNSHFKTPCTGPCHCPCGFRVVWSFKVDSLELERPPSTSPQPCGTMPPPQYCSRKRQIPQDPPWVHFRDVCFMQKNTFHGTQFCWTRLSGRI